MAARLAVQRGHLAAVALACCCALGAAAGCGSDSSGSTSDGATTTRSPEATFAPLVELDPQERWLPLSADWFLDRSLFGFADDQGCPDRPIAVGRQLEELRTPIVDWLGKSGLGRDPHAYFRDAYAPATPEHDAAKLGTPCPYRGDRRFDADQLTRPHERRDRVEGLRLTEGFYLDLTDRARPGQPPRSSRGAEQIAVPAYVERLEQDVAGEPGLRVTYWLLYGMNQPLDPRGDPIAARTHEGDWERVDVLLHAGGGDDEWTPFAVRLLDDDGNHRDIPWASIERTAADATHPLLTAARGDHTLSPAPRDTSSCTLCPRWLTWTDLAPVRRQPWYGFGGAWGEPGDTSDTTGPLGPHGKWPPDSPYE